MKDTIKITTVEGEMLLERSSEVERMFVRVGIKLLEEGAAIALLETSVFTEKQIDCCIENYIKPMVEKNFPTWSVNIENIKRLMCEHYGVALI